LHAAVGRYHTLFYRFATWYTDGVEGEWEVTGACCMAKKRVYVETSVLSYLTARPAKDELTRIHQHLTAVWWERRLDWECFLTQTVLAEVGRGDPEGVAPKQPRGGWKKPGN